MACSGASRASSGRAHRVAWHVPGASGHARSGQVLVSLCLGKVLACSVECREASWQGEMGRGGPERK
jgi:hypothetical protein